MASTSNVQKLNNWLQQTGRPTKLSWDEKCEGPNHAPEWTVTVYVEGKALGTGGGSKKNLARDVAARQALEVLHAEYVASGGVVLEDQE